METEKLITENFANLAFADAAPGYATDNEVPAMATPATPQAATMVVQGSTICLIC